MREAKVGGWSGGGASPLVAEFSELVGANRTERVRFGVSLTIGRHPTNGLRIDEPLVSSFHAVIERCEDGWSVRDLGSRNGTSLNGRRLSGRAGLREGDVLRFAHGAAWCVERLLMAPHPATEASLSRTQGPRRSLPDDLQVELSPAGPMAGLVAARWGRDMQQQVLVGTAFLLLDRLARAPGQWITDAQLRSCLWGRRGERLSRSALHTPIYHLRRLFEGWGIEGRIIEKEHGATRLNLDPGQVVRVGLAEDIDRDADLDGEE